MEHLVLSPAITFVSRHKFPMEKHWGCFCFCQENWKPNVDFVGFRLAVKTKPEVPENQIFHSSGNRTFHPPNISKGYYCCATLAKTTGVVSRSVPVFPLPYSARPSLNMLLNHRGHG